MAALLTILGVVGAIVTVSIVNGVRENRRLRLLAEARQGESICSFVRSLDYRSLDTTVIRAVYEGVQAHLKHVHPAFPVRPCDDIDRAYGIDSEEYEDMVLEIAGRAGRSLEDYEQNPYYHQVSTASGLIQFLCTQPMANGA